MTKIGREKGIFVIPTATVSIKKRESRKRDLGKGTGKPTSRF